MYREVGNGRKDGRLGDLAHSGRREAVHVTLGELARLRSTARPLFRRGRRPRPGWFCGYVAHTSVPRRSGVSWSGAGLLRCARNDGRRGARRGRGTGATAGTCSRKRTDFLVLMLKQCHLASGRSIACWRTLSRNPRWPRMRGCRILDQRRGDRRIPAIDERQRGRAFAECSGGFRRRAAALSGQSARRNITPEHARGDVRGSHADRGSGGRRYSVAVGDVARRSGTSWSGFGLLRCARNDGRRGQWTVAGPAVASRSTFRP